MVWERRRYPFGSIGQEIDEMMAEMEARFQDVFSGSRNLLPESGGGVADRFMPAIRGDFRVDVSDHEDEVVIVADLPGFEKEGVSVQLYDPRTLEISTRQSTEKKDERENYYMRERMYGSMRRMVRLPVDVTEDGAQATFKNGVLEVHLKKTEAPSVRAIQIE
ncbi:Hsp20/alpha crystallin family protein [Methanocalculus taiwanensis]|uniref:Hsp20/alpha crystallin family protein n=1 Tax=Methanocalculus taiwanensis TaxID=106207 RepID=A0ABD4TIF0_9EURY|nr:Hsp20/alpha crystallin family protein [Methanocalculus taiwanensis]MCQ1538067.1 Hsp20/alpha crystallin family protein [Methanocalculus taiwanensis]